MKKTEIFGLAVIWLGILSISLVEFLPNVPVVGIGFFLISFAVLFLAVSVRFADKVHKKNLIFKLK